MDKDEALKLALEALEQTLQTLDDENAKPGGAIADTIWHSEHETLFDYLGSEITAIKEALAQPAQELTLQEQLDKANVTRDKAHAYWDKAHVDWVNADAGLDKAYADRRKARAEWDKADAETKRIEKLMEQQND